MRVVSIGKIQWLYMSDILFLLIKISCYDAYKIIISLSKMFCHRSVSYESKHVGRIVVTRIRYCLFFSGQHQVVTKNANDILYWITIIYIFSLFTLYNKYIVIHSITIRLIIIIILRNTSCKTQETNIRNSFQAISFSLVVYDAVSQTCSPLAGR